ncbi:MAG: hypothetical protein U0Q12_11745 [Vicinamibacterales bacterium]
MRQRYAKVFVSSAVAVLAGLDSAALAQSGLMAQLPLIAPVAGWGGLLAAVIYFNHTQVFDRRSYGWCFRRLALAVAAFVAATHYLPIG